jgi:phage shock protein A
MTLKPLIYCFFGDRTGRVLSGIWNWLWGIPVETGGKISVEVAQESLISMQASVMKFTKSVAEISASYQRAKLKYESKQREFEEAQNQAIRAHQLGNEAAARLAMGKAIAIEQLLPQFAQQVAQAEQVLKQQQDRLNREQLRLETYKVDLHNLKDIQEVSAALGAIAKAQTTLDMGSARSQFEDAKSAVQNRYLKANAFAELSENPAEKLTHDLEKMTLDDEISHRLKQLQGQA